LYAFAAGCASGGGTCTPLWTATTGGAIGYSSPAVSDGVVYVGSDDHKLYAFAVGCASGGGTCTPLWTATTGSAIGSSPEVANGVVYVGSQDANLYAFAVGCASGGATCTPLWTATTGRIYSSPAVANGVVYAGSDDGKLYAFAVGCASGGGSCTPLWTATAGGSIDSSPAVSNGVVYVGSWDGKLYAYAVGCASGGGTCTPLWTATTGGGVYSSPAVANGVVYVGSQDGNLYAYAAGCASGGGGSCTPLWTATTGGAVDSSPAVANGVVYAGSEDGELYAFAVGCASGGGSCTPLWMATTGSSIYSSPAVVDGVVYVGSAGSKLFAFGLVPATYHALTPTRILDTRDGIGLAGAFSSHVARTFQVTGRGNVPSAAIAVTGNLTVTQQTSSGFLFIGPVAMNNPTSSTLNFPVGDDRANAVTVVLGTGGKLSVTYAAATLGPTAQVIFDVTGYFTPDMSGATYHALTPARILDSRDHTGGLGIFSSHVAQTFQVTGNGGVAANATAVTGNLTVTGQSSAGFLYIGPAAQNNPTSSTLNFPLGDDRANAVTVALGAGGKLSVTYAAPTLGPTAQVIFDVTGYFVPDTSGATYVPLNPTRLLDTRSNTGLTGPSSSHVARPFAVTGGVVPANAVAVTGNLTVTQQTSAGFLFIGPVAMNNPTSSTLNFPVGDDRANAVTVALGTGGTLSVTYAASTLGPTAHVLFDVTGYFMP
jgi:outer membrane protein assembly factor BamB